MAESDNVVTTRLSAASVIENDTGEAPAADAVTA